MKLQPGAKKTIEVCIINKKTKSLQKKRYYYPNLNKKKRSGERLKQAGTTRSARLHSPHGAKSPLKYSSLQLSFPTFYLPHSLQIQQNALILSSLYLQTPASGRTPFGVSTILRTVAILCTTFEQEAKRVTLVSLHFVTSALLLPKTYFVFFINIFNIKSLILKLAF